MPDHVKASRYSRDQQTAMRLLWDHAVELARLAGEIEKWSPEFEALTVEPLEAPAPWVNFGDRSELAGLIVRWIDEGGKRQLRDLVIEVDDDRAVHLEQDIEGEWLLHLAQSQAQRPVAATNPTAWRERFASVDEHLEQASAAAGRLKEIGRSSLAD